MNPKWETWKYNPTSYHPAPNDPTMLLNPRARVTFACIRYTESRGHVVDRNSGGAEGLYQFMPETWYYGAKALHFKGNALYHPDAATAYQQSEIAAWYYHRNGGFRPEWTDGCPGE
jgi:hypothetical protein